MKELVSLFKALGDQTRMRLMRAIASGMADKVSVNELAEILGVSQPTASQHIRILRSVDLVEPEREGNRVYYRVNRETLESYRDKINSMIDVLFTQCHGFPHCGE